MVYSDDQEVTRTIGDLKKTASINWYSGFFSGMGALAAILVGLAFIGLYLNI